MSETDEADEEVNGDPMPLDLVLKELASREWSADWIDIHKMTDEDGDGVIAIRREEGVGVEIIVSYDDGEKEAGKVYIHESMLNALKRTMRKVKVIE